MRCDAQVRRQHARAVSAQVVEHEAGGDFGDKDLVNEPMSQETPSSLTDDSVAGVRKRSPNDQTLSLRDEPA